MIEFYLVVLGAMIATACAMVMFQPSRIFDYPVFTHLVYGGVLGPQIFVVYKDWQAVTLESFEHFLLLSVLCLAMSWVGFAFTPFRALYRTKSIRLNFRRLEIAGWVLLALGNIVSILLFNTDIERNSEGQATGIFTILIFLFNITIIPSYAIMILLFLRQFTVSTFLGILLAVWCPLFSIVMYGRRESAVVIGVIPISLLYWVHKIEPPRWVILPSMILLILMVQAIGQYRAYVAEYGAGALVDFNPFEEFNRRLDSEYSPAPEASMACFQIEYASRMPLNYGANFWNRIIFHTVPAQIVGRDIKDGLMLRVNPPLFATNLEHHPAAPPGTVPTAISDTYAEFGYLGCILFALISYFYKCLRVVCVRGGDAGSLVYSVTCTSAMVALTHGAVEFLPAFISFMITLGPIIWFSLRK